MCAIGIMLLLLGTLSGCGLSRIMLNSVCAIGMWAIAPCANRTLSLPPERCVAERQDKMEVRVLDKGYPFTLVASYYPSPFLRLQNGVGYNGGYLGSLLTV